jgi:hypothetical protein
MSRNRLTVDMNSGDPYFLAYVAVRKKVRDDCSLTAYAVWDVGVEQADGFHFSYEFFMTELKCGEKTIRRAIKELESNRYLTVLRGSAAEASRSVRKAGDPIYEYKFSDTTEIHTKWLLDNFFIDGTFDHLQNARIRYKKNANWYIANPERYEWLVYTLRHIL